MVDDAVVDELGSVAGEGDVTGAGGAVGVELDGEFTWGTTEHFGQD